MPGLGEQGNPTRRIGVGTVGGYFLLGQLRSQKKTVAPNKYGLLPCLCATHIMSETWLRRGPLEDPWVCTRILTVLNYTTPPLSTVAEAVKRGVCVRVCVATR